MPTVLITGASRGIGLEFARQYGADGWRVLATCRDPGGASDLRRASPAVLQALDVDSDESVGAAAKALDGEAIDLLICNAGAYEARGRGATDMDFAAFERTMRTNTIGPIRVAGAFAGHVLRSGQKRMVAISSRMGSIGECGGGAMAYRASKAGLNMAWTCLSMEFAGKGVTAIVMHPGWVKTVIGGGDRAPLTPTDSVTAMRRTIAGLTPRQNGAFLNLDGTPIPW